MRELLDMHWHLLHDENRLAAFARALRSVVTPHSVVLDLGCGTGILGLLACRAGAAKVYAIDVGGVLDAARAIARSTEFADRIVHISGNCTSASIPEPVDVIVGDQMGPLGFEAGLVGMYEVAVRRLLRPGGTVVPEGIETWIAPAEAPALRAAADRWNDPVGGIDVSIMRAYEANTADRVKPGEVRLLGDGLRIAVLRPGCDSPSTVHSTEVDCALERSGRLDGFCGWFVADLANGIRMSNGIADPHRICRQPAFLPIDPAIETRAGDRISGTVGLRPATNLVEWRGQVHRNGRTLATFAHSTLPGLTIATRQVAP